MSNIISLLPGEKKVTAGEKQSLLELIAQAGHTILSPCGGKGVCGKCKVQILSGNPGPLSKEEETCLSQEEIQAGYRLACKVMIEDDLTVRIPEGHGNSARKKRLNALPEGFQSRPLIKKQFEKVPKATLEEQTNDLDRIRRALGKPELAVNTEALITIQKAISEKRGKMTAVLWGGKDDPKTQELLLTAETGDTEAYQYGLAIDIGTTTVVAMLWDLNRGVMTDSEATANPQAVHGSDVISRIQYCMEEETHTGKLQEMVIHSINEMIEKICTRNAISPQYIYEAAVVGNTTMSHLFLGVNPASLARIPFSPVFREGIYQRADTLHLQVNPQAKVYVLPNIAGHVGSDITAVMLAADIFGQKGNTLAIDIGTNGEILAAKDGQVMACSTAAGPAFEGASIQCGMRAAKGAIERVEIRDTVKLQTIEKAPPIGICGSGLIDLVAQLLSSGLVNENGNLLTSAEARQQGLPEELCRRLYGQGADKGFLLGDRQDGEKIVITQKDIREVQLAKGAILGGMLTLLKKLSIQKDDIDRLIIAGAFGNYIDKESAVRIGLLPDIPTEKIISIGNGAGTGASMALLNGDMRRKAEEQTQKITHVELSQDMDFQDYYIDSMLFPGRK